MQPQPTILLSKVLIINPDNKILVLQRSETDTRRPLTWDLPGGFLDQGEDPTVAAIRETEEEAGIKIEDPQIFHANSFNDTKYGIRLFYYARPTEIEVKLSYEHDKYKWVSKEEFSELDAPEEFKEAVKLLPI